MVIKANICASRIATRMDGNYGNTWKRTQNWKEIQMEWIHVSYFRALAEVPVTLIEKFSASIKVNTLNRHYNDGPFCLGK
jgi:hypothetical protein